MPVREADLDLGARLGKGAAAEILEVRGLDGADHPFPLVYKRYFSPDAVSAPGIERLQRFHDGLAESTRRLLDSRTAWPLETVDRSPGTFAGYLMPRLPPDAFVEVHTATGSDRVPCEIQFLFNDTRTLVHLIRGKVPAGYRLAIAIDLARTYSLLHKHGLVYGDLSWKNLIWTPFSARPHVVLVDCEAIRMRGETSAAPQLHSPGWIPPESSAGAHHQTVETDRYKLGLAIVRILSPGLHSQVRSPDPERDRKNLDVEGAELARRALAGAPAERPTAREWVDALNRLTQKRPLRAMERVQPAPAHHRPQHGGHHAAKTHGGKRRPGTGSNVGNRPAAWPGPPPVRAVPVGAQGLGAGSRPPTRRSSGNGIPLLIRLGFLAGVLVYAASWLQPLLFGGGAPGSTEDSSTVVPRTTLPSALTDPTSTIFRPPTAPTVPVATGLAPGAQLSAGRQLGGADGSSLELQADGDLVLRSGDPDGAVVWRSGSIGTGADLLVLQTDGDLVLRSNGSAGPVVWRTGTAGNPGATLAISADGLELRSALDGRTIWTSGQPTP